MELVKELMLPIDQCVAVNQELTIRDSIRLAQEPEDQRRRNGEAFSPRALLVLVLSQPNCWQDRDGEA